MRVSAFIAILTLTGCEASFEDLRSGSSPVEALDASAGGGDSGAPDGGSELLDGGPSGGSTGDVGLAVTEVVLARGTWAPADYEVSGRAEVVRLGDGRLELRLSEDFRSSAVPGPVVVFTTRSAIGSRIQPGQGDIRIGELRSNRGAQSYAVPAAAADARFVWVYCEPFGLEVGVAELR